VERFVSRLTRSRTPPAHLVLVIVPLAPPFARDLYRERPAVAIPQLSSAGQRSVRLAEEVAGDVHHPLVEARCYVRHRPAGAPARGAKLSVVSTSECSATASLA
jgi:hypothetical protein